MRTALDILVVLVAVLVLLTLLAHLLVWRVTAASPPTGQWMDIEGERLHYRSLGQGPALVLVHGLGGESRNFDYLPLNGQTQQQAEFMQLFAHAIAEIGPVMGPAGTGIPRRQDQAAGGSDRFCRGAGNRRGDPETGQ